ncbi:MAG: hypothetical protein V2A54_10870 [Bacteroidota bacterium]
MKKIKTLSLITLICLIAACSNKKTENTDAPNMVTVNKVTTVIDLSSSPDFGQTPETAKEGKLLIKTIFDKVMVGKVKTYDGYDFKKEITPKEFLASFESVDSVTMPNPQKPEKDTLMVIKKEFNVEDFNGISFQEEWKMDQSSLKFEKKVLGFAPVMRVYTTDPATGNIVFKGWKAAFFVKNQ